MKKAMYSIYDLKSEFYSPPMPFHNDEDAKRAVSGLFQNPQSPYTKFPEDYRLFSLGVFDDNSGGIIPADKPAYICELSTLNPHPKLAEPMEETV